MNVITSNEAIDKLRKAGIVTITGRLSTKYKRVLAVQTELLEFIVAFTDFLTYDAPISVRIHCILKLIDTQPVCKICRTPVKMQTTGRGLYTFPTYCSSRCTGNDIQIINKRKITCLERYDSTTYSQSDEGKKRTAATNLGRYGSESALGNPAVRQKMLNTLMSKYGTVNVASLDSVKQKRKQTLIRQHGSLSQHQDHINSKRKETLLKQYGVDNVFKSDEVQRKRTDTMLKKYGVEYPLQCEESKERFSNTMKTVYGHTHWWSSNIDPENLNILQTKTKFEHLLSECESSPVLLANRLGVDITTVYHHCQKYEIKLTVTNRHEIFIKSLLESLDVTFTQNDRIIVKPKELDFVVPTRQLAIEINGVFWHSELNGKDKNYHLNKTKKANEQGYQLLHILDHEIINKPDIVQSRIKAKLGTATKIYGRLCTITELSSSQSREFFNDNHIQGNAPSRYSFGLWYNNQLVAAISFGALRYTKNKTDSPDQYELIRYCNLIDHSVLGGASKLFKHFIKLHNPSYITTYSDNRWNTGNMYKQMNFKYSHSSPPSYHYFKRSGSDIKLQLFNRVQFQKHKLKDKLTTFDPNLTEWQNMVNNGYDRIWDCGNSVWEWRRD